MIAGFRKNHETEKRKANFKGQSEKGKNKKQNGGNNMLRNWFKDEEGQGMVEYGLIIGLIAVVVIVALVALGPKIREMFNDVNEKLDEAAKAGTSAPAAT